MIGVDRTALILLAAGLSTRFGSENKLAKPLRNLPLGLHVARTVAAFPFAARIAVTAPRPLDFTSYGFITCINDDPAAGQGHSIARGMACIEDMDVDAVLIMLADMPFVTAGHISALLDGYEGRHSIVASATAASSSPPALFGAAHFVTLAGLTGERGARLLINHARLITAPSAELADIDTIEDLAVYR